MIFEIDPEFINRCPSARLSDIICTCARNGHYIKCDRESLKIIKTAIKDHASTTEKELFKAHRSMFDISGNKYRFLRVLRIDPDFHPTSLLYLAAAKARLILENANHEWIIYKYFIDRYSNHPVLGDGLSLLRQAKERRRIKAIHAGGWGEMLKIADQDPHRHNGKNLRLYKTCIVFDRDTDNDHSFDENKNALFSRLANKKADTIAEQDIYHLKSSAPMWHMWHKRAIENYFPVEQYKKLGCDTTNLEVLTDTARDYLKIESKSVKGYDKNNLPKLLDNLDLSAFEKKLKKFDIDGQEYSEIEIFLLKLVKII